MWLSKYLPDEPPKAGPEAAPRGVTAPAAEPPHGPAP